MKGFGSKDKKLVIEPSKGLKRCGDVVIIINRDIIFAAVFPCYMVKRI